VTIELPARLLAALQRSSHEARAIEKDALLAAASDWYRGGLVSQGRAAGIAGIPRAEFIDALAARQIEVVQIDLASLDRDIERA
jgi:predicted HTH domain antitoxin